MTSNEERPQFDIDLFDFVDILFKRKWMILSIFGVAIFLSAIYCYLLRSEAPEGYVVKIGIRHPQQSDVVSLDPNDPSQKINIARIVKDLVVRDQFNGKLQDRFKFESVPDIEADIQPLPVLILTLYHKDKNEGRKILEAAIEFIQQDEILRRMIEKEKKLLLADIDKFRIENETIDRKIVNLKDIISTIDRILGEDKENLLAILKDLAANTKSTELAQYLEVQLRQLELSRMYHNELLYRLVQETTHNKEKIINLEYRLEPFKNPFLPQGTISTSPYFADQVSAKRVIAVSGIIGLAIGFVLAFLLGVKARRFNTM